MTNYEKVLRDKTRLVLKGLEALGLQATYLSYVLTAVNEEAVEEAKVLMRLLADGASVENAADTVARLKETVYLKGAIDMLFRAAEVPPMTGSSPVRKKGRRR